jgi:hypothetical protein
MRETKCELVRRELEELLLDEQFSDAAAEHLERCADCREFERQQTKLRQIVGSLGTVNAPADFDFRLRARLAADSQRSTFRYWSLPMKSLATAAVLVVLGVGFAIAWKESQQQAHVAEVPPIQTVNPKGPDAPKPLRPAPPSEVPAEAPSEAPRPALANNAQPPKIYRPAQSSRPKRQLATADFSGLGADVENGLRNTATVFPIETSLQPFTVSLEDGRGNARRISVPTVSFGSQRTPLTANQFAPKNVW